MKTTKKCLTPPLDTLIRKLTSEHKVNNTTQLTTMSVAKKKNTSGNTNET
jgi:hypothetical protein